MSTIFFNPQCVKLWVALLLLQQNAADKNVLIVFEQN